MAMVDSQFTQVTRGDVGGEYGAVLSKTGIPSQEGALSADMGRLLRYSLESISEAVFWVCADGRFVYANAAAVRMLGQSREDVLRLGMQDVCPTYTGPTWDNHWTELERQGSRVCASTLVRFDGRSMAVEIAARLIPLSKNKISIHLVREHVEQHGKEEVARRYCREFNAILSALPDLYFHVDGNGYVTDFLAGRTSGLLVTADAFVGRRLEDLMTEHAAPAFIEAANKAHQGKQPVVVDCQLHLGQGPRTFEARLAPLEGREMVVLVRDVTEQRRGERTQKENECMFRGLFEYSMDAVFTIDLQTNLITDTNRAASDLTGWSKAEMSGMHYLQVHPQDEREQTGLHLLDVLHQPGSHMSNAHVLHRSGNRIPVEVRSAGYLEYHKRPCVLSIYRSLALQHETERALHRVKARQQLLEGVIDRGPVMMLRWRNEPGRPIDFASENVVRLGFTASELMAGRMSWTRLVHPEDGLRVDELLAQQARDRRATVPVEFRLVDKAGIGHWMAGQITAVYLPGGGITHYEVTALDTTEKQHLGRDLRETREMLNLALQHTLTGAWSWDITRDQMWWSGECWQILRRRPEDGKASYNLLLSCIIPGDRPVTDEYVRRAVALRLPLELECQLICMDGHSRRIRMTGRFLESPADHTFSLVGILQDISNRDHNSTPPLRTQDLRAPAVAGAPEGS